MGVPMGADQNPLIAQFTILFMNLMPGPHLEADAQRNLAMRRSAPSTPLRAVRLPRFGGEEKSPLQWSGRVRTDKTKARN